MASGTEGDVSGITLGAAPLFASASLLISVDTLSSVGTFLSVGTFAPLVHAGTAIAVTKLGTLVLGGLISYLGWRAYSRTGAAPLRALAVGFAIVTVGAAAGGVVDQFLFGSQSTLWGVLVSSVLTLVGFGVITYSLYME